MQALQFFMEDIQNRELYFSNFFKVIDLDFLVCFCGGDITLSNIILDKYSYMDVQSMKIPKKSVWYDTLKKK